MSPFKKKLTKKTAQEYFEAFVGQAPQRLEEFRDYVTQHGGPEAEQLDFSPESLVPLWSWMRLRVKRTDQKEEGPLPLWFLVEGGQSAHHNPFSLETLWLIDGFMYYVAECFIRNVEGAHWKIAYTPSGIRSYDQNKPVIAIHDGEIALLSLVITWVLMAADKHERDTPESALGYYNYIANKGRQKS